MILGLVFALVVAAFQQGGFAGPQAAIQQRAHDEYERHKQAAIRINELAGRIHAEADASAFVSAIAGLLVKELPPAWTRSSIRRRVAHAEYKTVGNPANLIPEQRIVDVWNQYVKKIGAPDEAIVSVAEIHNMRDGSYTVAQLMWAQRGALQGLSSFQLAEGRDGNLTTLPIDCAGFGRKAAFPHINVCGLSFLVRLG